MPVTMPVGDTLADRPLTRAVLIGLTDAVGVRPGPDAALEPVATLERPGRRCDIYRHPATKERYVAVLRTSAAPGPRVLADGAYQCCRASARANVAAPHRPAAQRTTATRMGALLSAITACGRRRRHLRSRPHEGGHRT
jgi:hypothetical protein